MTNTLRHTFSVSLFIGLCTALFLTQKLLAAGPFLPGTTLMPSCAPGDALCTVSLFPDQVGNAGKVLSTDGSGTLLWKTVSEGGAATSSLLLSGNSLFLTSGASSSQVDLSILFASSTRDVTFGQVQGASFLGSIVSSVSGFFSSIFGGSATIGNIIATSSLVSQGTLSVSGNTTLQNASTSNLSVSSGLSVSGSSSLATTTVSNLTVTGTSTFSDVTASIISSASSFFSTIFGGSATIGNIIATSSLVSQGTLDITGTSTLATTSVSSLSVSGSALFSSLSTNSLAYLDASNRLAASSSILSFNSTNRRLAIGSSTGNATLLLRGYGSDNPLLISSSSGQTMMTLDQAGRLLLGTTTSSLTFGNLFQGTTTLATTNGQTALRVMGNVDNTLGGGFQPTLVATTSMGTGFYPSAITVSGKYVYGVDAYNAFGIVDVSTASSPQLVATTTVGGYSIAVSGRYAYFASNWTGVFYVVDISKPSTPTVVATTSTSITETPTSPTAIITSGKYAYTVDNTTNSLEVIDVSNPLSPRLIGTVSTGGLGASGLSMSGQYIYITNNNSNFLSIVNISKPSNPLLVATTSIAGGPLHKIVTSGRYAYAVSYSSSTLSVIDIKNPIAPTFVASTSVGGFNPISMFVSGRYAYTANSMSGSISVIDISRPNAPTVVATTSVGSSVTAIAVSGRYAYVASDFPNLLSIYDIGGLETNGATIASLDTGNVSVRNSLDVQGLLNVGTGLSIGVGGFQSQGDSSVYGSFTVGTSTLPLFLANATLQRIGVGTSTMNAMFGIQGTAGVNPFSVASSSGGSLFTVTSGGKVGIGTSTPSQKLQVLGDIRVGTGGATGCVEDFSGTPIGGTCSSDEKLKENIQEIPSVFEKYGFLRPVTYFWNASASEVYNKSRSNKNTGIIAQDVESQFPELVTTDPQGFKRVDFQALSIYTIKAVAEIASFSSSFTSKLSTWLGSSSNGLKALYTELVSTKRVETEMLCVKKANGEFVCINGDTLQKILTESQAQIIIGGSNTETGTSTSNTTGNTSSSTDSSSSSVLEEGSASVASNQTGETSTPPATTETSGSSSTESVQNP